MAHHPTHCPLLFTSHVCLSLGVYDHPPEGDCHEWRGVRGTSSLGQHWINAPQYPEVGESEKEIVFARSGTLEQNPS